MVTDRNQTFDGEYNAVYTDAELYCCTPETYITK